MKPYRSSLLFIFFALFLSILPTNSWARVRSADLAELSFEEIGAHARLTNLLLCYFPPDEYHYVILGRSPALMAARLEARNISFSHLPLSFRFSSMHVNGEQIDYSRPMNADLMRHFTRYLPPPSNIIGKKLVLVDYVISGRSLLSAMRMVERYYKDKIVHFFGFGDEEDRFQKYKQGWGLFVDLEKIDPSRVTSKGFFTGRYKAFACNPSFRFVNMSSDYYEDFEAGDSDAIRAHQNYRRAVEAWPQARSKL